MIKKILVFIIFFIISYDIYFLYNFNKEVPPNDKKIADESQIISKDYKEPINYKENINELYFKNLKNNIDTISYESRRIDESNETMKYYENYTEPVKYIENKTVNYEDNGIPLDLFGKPTEYVINSYIIWDYLNGKPWTKVVYNYNEKYPFNFYIKVKIPSLNDYDNWKNIISNIDFNPRTGEIVIPAVDEESALSIGNLILINFRGEITIDEILKRNLIEISINKARKYEIVKNKLKEQLMSSHTIMELAKEKEVNPIYEKDLANTNTEYGTYEGVEYSFF
jgi:hypothetical protein